MSNALALYVHIPFCRRKCSYCDFYSLAHAEELHVPYAAALKAEIAAQAGLWGKDHRVETVYFGGGTPNLLPTAALDSLMDLISARFPFSEDPEISIEINPEFSHDRGSLAELRGIGFNRLSIGVQSLNDRELKLLGRLHTAETALSCLRHARELFDNMSADIIYAVPEQTPASLLRTLGGILESRPEHLSAYSLTVEAGTPLDLSVKNGQLQLSGDDADRDHFLFVRDHLLGAGYEQYEISNYARPPFRSRHNSAYWSGQDYLGVGPSAHSKLGDVRYDYPADIHAFLDPASRRFRELETVSDADTLITALRTSEGLARKRVSPETWHNILEYTRLHPEWFIAARDTIRCSTEGWLFLDSILVDLI